MLPVQRRSKKRQRDKDRGKHSKHKRRKKEEKESSRKEKRGKKAKSERKESKRKDSAKDVASKKDTGERARFDCFVAVLTCMTRGHETEWHGCDLAFSCPTYQGSMQRACNNVLQCHTSPPHVSTTHSQGPVTNQFGAHGVIREGDLGAKRSEFQAWAIETQNVDIEILGKVPACASGLTSPRCRISCIGSYKRCRRVTFVLN